MATPDIELQPVTIVGKREKLPGYIPERLKNPLSAFSSSTYQISLYMVSPETYNMLYANGDTNKQQLFAASVDGSLGVGARLIAQSGGSQNKGADTRAAGFELDYYIDNLKIHSAISGTSTGTSSCISEISFNIIEPYGFSLITNLVRAANSLAKESNTPNYTDPQNPTKQFFVLGIRFQGYDKNGKVMTGADLYAEDTMQTTSTGVFERFFDLTSFQMHFKIEGKATTYAIKAANTPIAVAHTTKRGKVSNDARIIAMNVAQAIGGLIDSSGAAVPTTTGMKGLLDILNDNQQALVKQKPAAAEFANVYKLRFLDDTGGVNSPIGKATLTRTTPKDKTRSAPAPANTTAGSNEATAVRSAPNLGTYTVTFKDGTPIMQAISEIIKHSSYMTDAQKTISQANEEANSIGPDGQLVTGGGSILRWYNLSTAVKIIGWDKIVGDWAYEITYVIQPYDTPTIATPYSNPPRGYYGPHKRYQYWYTGQNSEILQYECTLDNAWFNTTNNPNGSSSSQGGGADTATVPNLPDDGIKSGGLPGSMVAQNAYVTLLIDPGGTVVAKIKILGDPDYLTCNSPGGIKEPYNQFYNERDMTINANGGQVFIEIDFKESKDYAKPDGSINGLMDINSNIMFNWKYPPEANIQGIAYKLNTCVSTFSNGTFTQQLEANLVTDWPALKKAAVDAARPALAPPGRGASSEGDAGEAEAQLNEATRLAYSDSSRALDVIPTTPDDDATAGVVNINQLAATSGRENV
jgi:hypothetical protein